MTPPSLDHASLFDRRARHALVVCLATLVICGVGFRAAVSHWRVYLQKLPVELRETLSDIPRRLGEWVATGSDDILTKEVTEELGTEQYLNRNYVRENGEGSRKSVLNLHIAYYTGMIDAVPHVPDRCLEAGGLVKLSPVPTTLDLHVDQSGWEQDESRIHHKAKQPYMTTGVVHYLTGRRVRVHMPVGELKLRTTEFQDPRQSDVHILAGYLFVANGQTTPSPYEVQTLAFDKTDHYAYYCKIQFMMGTDSTNPDYDGFVEQVSALLGRLLPEVMRCLPDWPEIEDRTQDSSPDAAAGGGSDVSKTVNH